MKDRKLAKLLSILKIKWLILLHTEEQLILLKELESVSQN